MDFLELWERCLELEGLLRELGSERLLGMFRRVFREFREEEADRLMRMIEQDHGRRIFRTDIDWILLDFDRRGHRALVRARDEPRLVALIGQDLHSGAPFYLGVPPYIRTVNQALEWAWDLPRGFWSPEIQEV